MRESEELPILARGSGLFVVQHHHVYIQSTPAGRTRNSSGCANCARCYHCKERAVNRVYSLVTRLQFRKSRYIKVLRFTSRAYAKGVNRALRSVFAWY